MMARLNTVVEALHLWQLESVSNGHLTLDDICQLAEDGGLASAGKDQIEHLSRCPECMKEWAAWRQAVAETASADSELQTGFGFLQAAGSESHKPFQLKSSCGRFTIDVLPQEDHPQRAMLVFEVAAPAKSGYEGQTVTVRDRDQNILVQGEVHNGQFARIVEGWDKFDLRKWTVLFRDL